MKKKNTGLEFEKLAEAIFKKLVKDSQFEKVEHNVRLEGIDGERQIDVLISSEVAGIEIKTVIECKDYNSKISVGKIDEFHSKLMDIKANKGILISKKGFSSTAIKKAKRLGITLCTAHEALKPSWSIDFDIPLIVEVRQPVSYDVKYKITAEGGDQVSEPHVINDIDILGNILEKWPQKKIGVNKKKGLQKINVEEIKPPLFVRLKNKQNAKRSISDLEVFLEVDNSLYYIPLSQVKNTQILNNISDNKCNFFMDIKSIFDLSEKFVKIPNNPLMDKIGVRLTLLITPQIQKNNN